jgi:hypothetical protein
MPSPLRAATFALLGLRVAYGAALIAAPERLALRWLGPAALQNLPVRPFLAASAAGLAAAVDR